jgi:hypothetical protein
LVNRGHDGASGWIWVNASVNGFGGKFHSQKCFDKINRIL